MEVCRTRVLSRQVGHCINRDATKTRSNWVEPNRKTVSTVLGHLPCKRGASFRSPSRPDGTILQQPAAAQRKPGFKKRPCGGLQVQFRGFKLQACPISPRIPMQARLSLSSRVERHFRVGKTAKTGACKLCKSLQQSSTKMEYLALLSSRRASSAFSLHSPGHFDS